MTTDAMTAEQIRRWKAGWVAVNQREIEELRAATTITKIRQLSAMMACSELFESRLDREADVEIARRRWLELYRACGY